MNPTNEEYIRVIIESVPRILTQLDRSASSKTYGCFDREYWHYKMSDFPSMRKQEAVLTIAYAFATNHKENPYYKSPQIKEFINAALNYWSVKAVKELSEWYPGEDSFVCNAFNLYAITQTYIVIGETPNRKILTAIEKIATKLSSLKETRVQNQYSSLPIGLYNTYLLTNKEKYKKKSEGSLNNLKKLQSEDGWFLEYGGADVGYLSLTIYYLSLYYQKTGSQDALKIIAKACSFIKYFIHPDYTSGGEYASRNTEYLIPAGFEIISREVKDAANIAVFIRKGLVNRKSLSLREIDDRYLLYLGATYFESYINGKKEIVKTKEEFNKDFQIYFPTTGLLVKNNSKYYFVANLKKGGSFQYINKKSLLHNYDSGILVKTREGMNTSSYLQEPNILKNNSEINIEGKLILCKNSIMTTTKLIIFRIIISNIAKIPIFGRYLREKLRDVLITKNKISRIKYRREFKIEEDHIEIADSLISKIPLLEVRLGEKYSDIFVPSSRLFQEQMIKNPDAKVYKLLGTKKFCLDRTYK
ncbi:hypothetical protein HY483_02480 [Candidatus Woesearchaeota archaeon]|nr:hypothetical protein [Candidatus Woesearchaeota archaeon]